MGTEVRPGEIITAPSKPRTPVDPNPMLILPSGPDGRPARRRGAGRHPGASRPADPLRGRHRADLRAASRWRGCRTATAASTTRPACASTPRCARSTTRCEPTDRRATESIVVVAPEAAASPASGSPSRCAVAASGPAPRHGLPHPPGPDVRGATGRWPAGARGLLSLPDYESIDAVVGGEVHASALAKRLREPPLEARLPGAGPAQRRPGRRPAAARTSGRRRRGPRRPRPHRARLGGVGAHQHHEVGHRARGAWSSSTSRTAAPAAAPSAST